MTAKRADLDAAIANYLKWEKTDQNKRFIEQLIASNDIDQLTNLLANRLSFGTAGLRGRMGPGFGQLNDLVVIQTAQGLVSYLLELDADSLRSKGLIIGHDARHNSARFARLVALAFLQKGVKVYFSEYIIPTPLIAYGLRLYGCQVGVVVTASHNPKEDNGIKVYWNNGVQIQSPHDKNVQHHITLDSNQQPWPLAWQHEIVTNLLNSGQVSPSHSPSPSPTAAAAATTIKPESQVSLNSFSELLVKIHADLSKAYFALVESLVDNRRALNQSGGICITYSAMHGVGHSFMARALELAGFEDIFPVELQKKPDPEFSSVRFPNPEEQGALELAFDTAKHSNSNLILACDPDADRCAAAIYDPKSGARRVFTGDEIGALLGWWLWFCHSSGGETLASLGGSISDLNDEPREARTKTHDSSESLAQHNSENCYMISTAVSSQFLKSMAHIEGFNFVETLTGFKFMGNTADELQRNGKRVLFAYEEAIGYMTCAEILDKDGILAAIQVAQCAAYLASQRQLTLSQHLDQLHLTYGYHYSLNSYFLCSDTKLISRIFESLQTQYPSSFGGPSKNDTDLFQVERVRDLNGNGYDSSEADKRPRLACSASSYMVTFWVDQDIRLSIRTSGTEPKIKYYSEIVAPLEVASGVSIDQQKARARSRLASLLEFAIERCLKPEENKLEPA